jgi:hypothetical protein
VLIRQQHVLFGIVDGGDRELIGLLVHIRGIHGATDTPQPRERLVPVTAADVTDQPIDLIEREGGMSEPAIDQHAGLGIILSSNSQPSDHGNEPDM